MDWGNHTSSLCEIKTIRVITLFRSYSGLEKIEQERFFFMTELANSSTFF